MEKIKTDADILKEKTIAVASGKGGVGKTTTCVNLAVFFARSGKKTALLDLDPLSDIATLLDIHESEAVLKKSGSNRISINVLPNLDLIFPDSKAEKAAGDFYDNFLEITGTLERKYDRLILDLPAGSLYEENLVFLKHSRRLIVVTNDEPTSHAASGAYIKKAVESGIEIEYLLWHNKYSGITTAGFDPGDLPGNYNRNVPEEDQFDFDTVTMNDIAFIPNDPAMDLLQSTPSLTVNILAQMSERIDFLMEERINEISYTAELPAQAGSLIKHFIHLNPYISNIEKYYAKLSEYIYVILETKVLSSAAGDYMKSVREGGINLFTEEERTAVTDLLKRTSEDGLMSDLVNTAGLVRKTMDGLGNENRLFYSGNSSSALKAVDRRISMLLARLHDERNNHSAYIVNTAGLLLFDFSLLKLLSSPTVAGIITGFIPNRKNSRGQTVRDKHSQILQLINEEKSYKSSYIKLLNTLFPVILKQTAAIVETFGTAGLLFRDSSGIKKDVYLKLLSTFLHNTVNSGLGVIVGFPFRPASSAFEKAATRLA